MGNRPVSTYEKLSPIQCWDPAITCPSHAHLMPITDLVPEILLVSLAVSGVPLFRLRFASMSACMILTF